jgi:replicative DNA helicase
MINRTPPYNIEAEKALIGAIFANNRAYEKVSEFLAPEHFSISEHGLIFEAIDRLISRGQIADVITLQRYFEQEQKLVEIGGGAYLVDLASSVITVGNAKHYGEIIHDLYLKRQLIDLCDETLERAYRGDVDDAASGSAGQLEAAAEKLYRLSEHGEYEGGFSSFKESLVSAIKLAEDAQKRKGRLAGVGTGFSKLDDLLGGLHKSDLLILAGRPAMGKTALATNIAFNAANTYVESSREEGAVVAIFSLEMSEDQLASRILSERTEISSDSLRKGHLSTDQFNKLVQVSQSLYKIPIFISKETGRTVGTIRTRARRLKEGSHNLGLIIIDYLQLLSGSSNTQKFGRVQEVSEISRDLKILAKDLNVPILALSQLSRNVEHRLDKRPQLADLRESGSIEQDADVVMFVYREEYYLEREEPVRDPNKNDKDFYDALERWQAKLNNARNVAEVIVAKHRHGPTGIIPLSFHGEFTRFGNLERDHNV